jgi:hypothetical protein
LLIPILKAEYAQHIAISPHCPLRNREGLAIVITTCVFVQVANKPTMAEKKLRVDSVYGMLVDGASRGNIVQFCAETFDVGERTADNYIAAARELIERDSDMSRPAFLAEALAGLRQIRLSAARRGQHQVCVNAIRLQAELVGLTGKSA